MTRSEHPHPARLAAFARSILACPSSVELVVDGVPDAVEGREFLGAEDPTGEPMFSCLVDSPLARAGAAHRAALLTLGSALGPVGSSDRDATLTLAGRLETRDRQDCPCCEEVRDVVALDLNFVLLARPEPAAEGGPARDRQLRVPLEHTSGPRPTASIVASCNARPSTRTRATRTTCAAPSRRPPALGSATWSG